MARDRNPTPSGIGDTHERQGATTQKKPPPPLPQLPGTPDPITGRPTPQPWETKTPVIRRRRKEIYRRQRLLRNAGFKITVDGVWGPRSQKLWNRYLKNRSVVIRDIPQDGLDLSDPRAAPKGEASRREQAYQVRIEERRKAAIQAKKNVERLRQNILDRAAILKRDPTKAREMSIHQIREVLVDEEVDYNPTVNVNLTKALQYKLVARGYRLKVNGVFDNKTVKALKKADAANAQKLRERMARLVVENLYEPGLVKAGDKPYWASVAIPEAGDFVQMIQSNAFGANLLLQDLMKFALKPETAWRNIKAENLARIANDLAPGGVGATMYRLTGDAHASPLWQYMVDVWGIQDFVPMGDYSLEGMPEELRRKALKARANNEWIVAQNEMAKSGTRGQFTALMNSTGPVDFENRMAQLAVEQEAKFKKIQTMVASRDSSFWGDALNGIFWLGDEVRLGAVRMFGDVAPKPKGEPTMSRADAEKHIKEMNPVARFAFEATLDPLNLIAPFRVASTGVALSLAAFGRSASVGRYTLVGGSLSTKGIKYTKGDWSKIDVGLSPLKIFPAHLPAFHATEHVLRKMAVTKDHVMSGASKRLRQATHLGFKAPRFKVAGVEYVLPKVGSKEANALRDLTETEMAEMMLTTPYFKEVVDLLAERGVSLKANHLRGIDSDLGAEVSGFFAESFRPMIAAVISLRTANSAFKHKMETAAETMTEREVADFLRLAQTEAEVEFQTILRAFGTWRAGGGDERLLGKYGVWGTDEAGEAIFSEQNLTEMLDSKVAGLLEEVNDIVLPAIQDQLEDMAEVTFRQLQQRTDDIISSLRSNIVEGAEHGSPLMDFRRQYAEVGKPGYEFVSTRRGKAAIYRDADGIVQGEAIVGNNGSVKVFVAEGARRKGVATKLYDTLEANGVLIDEVSGKSVITGQGAAFLEGRLKGKLQHPMWDASGNWRGAAAHKQGDLVASIKESFENQIKVKNHRYGRGHTDLEFTSIITRELSRHLGRLDSFSARRIAQLKPGDDLEVIGGIAHNEKEKEIIEGVTKNWARGEDGMWYDQRAFLYESKLYARHLGAYDSPLTFDPATGEIDILAHLGRASAPSDMSRFERNLLKIAASMADVWETELAGTGFRAPPGGLDGPAFKEHAKTIRKVIDRRKMAIRMSQESALPKLLLEQGAVWRAWQYAQGRKTQLAYRGMSAQLALWKFATLALRPAWAIRNLIDNVAKGFVAGVFDPRYYVAGPTAASLQFVHEVGVNQLRDVVNYFDQMFGTTVGKFLMEIIDTFWSHSAATLSRIFKAQLIEVPPEVMEMGLRKDVWDKSQFRLISIPDSARIEEIGLDAKAVRAAAKKPEDEGWATRTRDVLWEIMGGAPENYMRRVIYRHTYAKSLKELSADTKMVKILQTVELEDVSVRERTFADVIANPDDYLYHGTPGQEAAMSIQEYGLDGGSVAGHWSYTFDYSQGGYIAVFRKSDFDSPSGYLYNEPTGQKPVAVFTARDFTDEISGFGERSAELGDNPEAYVPWTKTSVRNHLGGEFDGAIPYKEIEEEVATAALNSAQIHLEATRRAVQKVEDTLFDYGKISVGEDNLKVFFPFIQFWRKNSVFWANTFATKPWVPVAILHFDRQRREAHGELPKWMERYIHTDEIADALAVVPGLPEAFEYLGLGDGAMFDPISMSSLAPFYRAFKNVVYGENEFLPQDRQARIGVVGAIIDTLNDWGLGMSPFLRKPLEAAGVANYRAWQKVFPQTALAEAFLNASGAEGIARMVASIERIASLEALLTLSLDGVGANEIADNFNYWVQAEVAGQVARGEKPSVEKAEETIRDWFLMQNLWGYFGGIYWRRATPEDMYLANLADETLSGELDYESLPQKDKKLLRLWRMRGMDRMTYERYIDLLPVIESFYRADNDAKNEIKEKNPEIIRWVDGSFTGKPVSQKFVRYAQRYVDQELYFSAMEIADSLDVSPEAYEMIENLFLSPELQEFWRKNNTPSRMRKRMLQAEVNELYQTLNKGYFAIPETDYEARDEYLRDNPELPRMWGKNDVTESYGAILGSAKADLRDIYFRLVEINGGGNDGFESAASFLKQYSFMFEGTPSEKKIEDGEWIPGGGKWSAERISDYRAAKPHLTWFFDTFMPSVGAKDAFAWLEKSDTEAAKLVKMYLKKYPSSKRLAWLKAAPHLKVYFGLPPEKRGEWLRGDSEGAKIVREFFRKYGDKESQHATDYLAAKKDLDFYFKIPKEKRDEWLKSGDPRAAKVLAYFKKYGKENQMARAFKKLMAEYPELAHGTPEQVKRMNFWREYFSLPPDQRPMFVLQNAEKAGVFVYGEFGEKENHDREQEYMRRAVGAGLSDKQSAYLYVKPLMDFYRKLPKDEKGLFLRANPELQWYFDNFTSASPTGDKKLDKLVDEYFNLPADSFARSEFLRKHPDVQDWFDSRSTPAEAAMRNLLEQYFALSGWQRKDFILDHPEIQTYFDMRREERDSEQMQREAFDDADPRLAPFYKDAEDLQRAAARMRAKLRQSYFNSLVGDSIETRRERRAA